MQSSGTVLTLHVYIVRILYFKTYLSYLFQEGLTEKLDKSLSSRR